MRLDILTSEWHRLLKPVLPHASTDKDSLPLQAVRLELGARALYAIATDRYTMGCERYQLNPYDRGREDEWPPVHIDKGEAAATLKMLAYSKEYDPPLRVTVDRSALLVRPGKSIDSWAVTIERPDDGTRLMLCDRRDPSEVTMLVQWRAPLAKAFTRPRGRELHGLDIAAYQLARWKDAVHGGERLRVWTGPERGDTLLVTVEEHFAGIMVTQLYIDDASRERHALPWAAELGIALDEGTGELASEDNGD